MTGWLGGTIPASARGAAADEAEANLGPIREEPGFFEGSMAALGSGFMRGGAMTGQAVSMAGSIVPRTLDYMLGNGDGPDETLTDRYFRATDDAVVSAINYWQPDPHTTGTAARVLGSVAEFGIPMMLGGGNPLATAITTSAQVTAGQGADLVRSGASAEEAGGVAAVQGLANLIGVGIATRGATVVQRAAFGAASNVAVNVPADAASSAILADNPALAERYDPFNVESRAADIIVGALFGAMTRGPVKTAELDAAATARQVAHTQFDTAPGKFVEPSDANAHAETLRKVQDDILEGREPSLPPDFEVKVRPDPARAEQARNTQEAIETEVAVVRDAGDVPPRSDDAKVTAIRDVGNNIIQILDDDGNPIGSFVIGRTSTAGPDGSSIPVIRVENSGIDLPDAIGKGLGIRAYVELADMALKDGGQLWSDRELSADAIRMYEGLKRRGYVVEENKSRPPNVTSDGKMVSKGNFVFKVTRSPEGKMAVDAPTPETIDLPRVVDAKDVASVDRVVREIVDANPDQPVAVVTDPDAPDGVRRLTAREALDEVDVESRQAEELSRGYEAAINCFLSGGA